MIAGLGVNGLVIAVVAIVAGVVLRSITGFGGSLVIAVGLSAIWPPAEAVPVVLLVDLPVGLAMLPTTWGRAHNDSTVPAVVAMAITTPLGVAVLSNVPAMHVRLALGALIIVSTALLAFQGPPTRVAGPKLFGLAGAVGGFLNGATSAGGPPLILAHYATQATHQARRASLSITFIAMDLVAVMFMALGGLINTTALQRAAVLLPFAVGIPLLVDRRLAALQGATVRPIALGALSSIGVMAVLNALA